MRIGNVLAHDATWMSDPSTILFANGNSLALIRIGDSTPRPYATLSGRAFALRWSPDHKTLRFTLLSDGTNVASIWEINAGESIKPHPVKGLQPAGKLACCGVWTASGSSYVFQAGDESTTDLWALTTRYGFRRLERITNGPLSYAYPVASTVGQRIYFFGFNADSGLYRYSLKARSFEADRSFLFGAYRIEYSRDGQWVVWTTAPGLRLWKARADGGREMTQVTPPGMETYDVHWSPNGSKLALTARREGGSWRIYIADLVSGAIDEVRNATTDIADPSWSADGQSLAFVTRAYPESAQNQASMLGIYDLRTHRVWNLPGSNNLVSPKWSPDGRWLAAVTPGEGRLMLFDFQRSTWSSFSLSQVQNPIWCRDSSGIYAQTLDSGKQTILRISIPDGKVTQVASSTDFTGGDFPGFNLRALSPQGDPIVTAKVGAGNLYSIDLDE